MSYLTDENDYASQQLGRMPRAMPVVRITEDGRSLYIDGSQVLGIDGGGEDEGVFALQYLTDCEACDSSGYVRSERCQWCRLREPASQSGAEYVALPSVTLGADDMAGLVNWALRQQFAPTGPGNERIAAGIIDAVRAYEKAVAGAATERAPEVRAA